MLKLRPGITNYSAATVERSNSRERANKTENYNETVFVNVKIRPILIFSDLPGYGAESDGATEQIINDLGSVTLGLRCNAQQTIPNAEILKSKSYPQRPPLVKLYHSQIFKDWLKDFSKPTFSGREDSLRGATARQRSLLCFYLNDLRIFHEFTQCLQVKGKLDQRITTQLF